MAHTTVATRKNRGVRDKRREPDLCEEGLAWKPGKNQYTPQKKSRAGEFPLASAPFSPLFSFYKSPYGGPFLPCFAILILYYDPPRGARHARFDLDSSRWCGMDGLSDGTEGRFRRPSDYWPDKINLIEPLNSAGGSGSSIPQHSLPSGAVSLERWCGGCGWLNLARPPPPPALQADEFQEAHLRRHVPPIFSNCSVCLAVVCISVLAVVHFFSQFH
jgi:hypothetical protein